MINLKKLFPLIDYLAIISVLVVMLVCCKNQKDTHLEPKDESVSNSTPRTDITSLEHVPKYGDTLSTLSGAKLWNPRVPAFSSSSSGDSVYTYSVSGFNFHLAKGYGGIVYFVSTSDSNLVTPEGVHVGMSFRKASELANNTILYKPGWGYYIKLPCGWQAGSTTWNKFPENEVEELPIMFLFRN